MWSVWRKVFLLVALTFLVGCGGSASNLGDGSDSRMDMRQAAERADGILDDTLGAITPEVRWTHDTTTVGSCSLTRRRTLMTIVSAQRRGNLLGVVERFWKSNGYKITSTNNSVDFPAIFAVTKDGFEAALIVGGEGQVFFEADTPCVQESEVADPTAKPNAPSYEGMENIPRPNIHSDFWSAATPASAAP
ncbi:hypothetical protein [Streptomyces sp. NPDC060184]|uniref:hypothetical protein n=1 Tax=Streptomyces sp. NPDC060184 TaxID=3347064 RepID=UPI0036527C92